MEAANGHQAVEVLQATVGLRLREEPEWLAEVVIMCQRGRLW